MKASTGVALLAAGTAQANVVPRDTASQVLCNGYSVEEAGNWYCQAVSQITYTNVGKDASYDQVVFMDPATGQCDFATKNVSSPIAPFDEGLSIHLRGPIILKQMAVYVPGTPTKAKREDKPHVHTHKRRHGHGHGHGHQLAHAARYAKAPSPVEEKRGEHPTIWITQVINGQTVSWTNDYWGPTTAPSVDSSAPAAVPAAVQTTAPVPPVKVEAAAATSTSVQSASVPASSSSSAAAASAAASDISSDFVRTAYYSASSGTSTGLTFLGNYGGVAGSGTWSSTFGNTLSYLASSGLTGAASAETLTNTTIPSGKEFSIFSDAPCTDGGADCGYVQPGSVAHAGFAGADKTFLFEFQMPHEQTPAGEQTDVPALWLLNARIPHTGQYSGCSCWASGCGEFDVFEVLNSGNDKCKSTFHSTFLGGDSNYFQRPVDESVKVAVVFDSASRSVSVTVLDSATDFAAGLSADQVRSFMNDAATVGVSAAAVDSKKSLFAITS